VGLFLQTPEPAWGVPTKEGRTLTGAQETNKLAIFSQIVNGKENKRQTDLGMTTD